MFIIAVNVSMICKIRHGGSKNIGDKEPESTRKEIRNMQKAVAKDKPDEK